MPAPAYEAAPPTWSPVKPNIIVSPQLAFLYTNNQKLKLMNIFNFRINKLLRLFESFDSMSSYNDDIVLKKNY